MNRLLLCASLLLLLLLALSAPDAAEALKCHKCGSYGSSGGFTACPDTYLDGDDAVIETCNDDEEYCGWFEYESGKSISGCVNSDEMPNHPEDDCEDDYSIPNTSISGKLCTCSSDECNGAPGGVAASPMAAALAAAVAVAAAAR